MVPPDVVAFVTKRFSNADQAEALLLLQQATMHDGTSPDVRLLRCAAVGSDGAIIALRRLLGMLEVDWRDVIVAGEYVSQGDKLVRARDLSQAISSET